MGAFRPRIAEASKTMRKDKDRPDTMTLPSSAPPASVLSKTAPAFSTWKIRLLTLLALSLVDGTYTVLRRYSRGVLVEVYSFNEVLLIAELLKLTFSIFMIRGNMRSSGDGRLVVRRCAELMMKSSKMLVLALLYGAGNILSYVALRRIGAGTFVIIAQLSNPPKKGIAVGRSSG